jgi:DNA recombination protein RmuC
MTIELIFILAFITLGFVVLYFLILQQLKSSQQTAKNDEELESVVNKIFGMSITKITEQSRHALASEKELIKENLDNRQQSIEKLVKQLQEDLGRRQDEIRELERDRTKKFSEITTAIDEHRKLTDELKVSTHQLAKVLSNNQQRGGWGERIIEDLLKANGLVEGVHYARQQTLANSALKPDISLLLPNNRIVPVDVKFPYSEIQKMADTDVKSAQQAHMKQFAVDLKVKVKKVAEYIDPSHNTLDYAIMFVPNEMVFSFINQKFPDIIDEAISNRVLIVSPFTFLIVARTVMESYRNFMIGDQLKEVVKFVDEFVSEWEKFRGQFDKYGRALGTLQTAYEDLTGTRVRQMERRIENIRGVQQGSLLAAADIIEEAEDEKK